ncbi:hypothetical protein DID88_007997 [Monilinia fructigena]|uniref:Uncharacterized protein n=1 Tax=Monilinia fructigena TaxID=38457 RepID=A0A395J411_9HELO|nr:hypothetical protein DID88_007997 [Monilinia fructigena]
MTANRGPAMADGPSQIPSHSRSLSVTNSDIPNRSIIDITNHKEGRPNLAPTEVWQTERPRATTKSSLPAPAYKRGQTNTSMLNEAIWSRGNDYRDNGSTSSSSSSEDEQEVPGEKRRKKRYIPGKKNLSDTGGRNRYNKFQVANDDFHTRGRVSKRDGRLNISVNETSNRGYLAKALGATFFNKIGNDNLADETPRGQPYQTVRIATHPAFRDFVQNDSGLEFFSVGGDPAELMAFMVKNPGMIPTMDTLKKGEVGRRRDQMAEIFEGFWRACINATDEEKDVTNLKMMGNKVPFVADAIIANPPCFAHVHCAERLGVPLHLMFTFPYTPTQAFPHPLANIKKTNVDPGYTNFMSYPLVEMMTWQGLGDLVNNFRVKTLVVDDPDKFTDMIFEAVKRAGVRALVSKGWGGLGCENTPDNVFMLENTPHDWLFPKVKAVVHHGGAGTTAIGLKCGKPTMIVPFFGDQQFWGSMIGSSGAGADPVPYKILTADKLAEGIKQCLTDKAREEAEKIAKNIEAEGDGAQNAVKSFHRSLTLRGEHSMRCSIFEGSSGGVGYERHEFAIERIGSRITDEEEENHFETIKAH